MVIKQFKPSVWQKHPELVEDELRATEGIRRSGLDSACGMLKIYGIALAPYFSDYAVMVPTIEMQHVEGSDLQARYERMTTAEKRSVLEQVAKQLRCLHALNLIHRDLKLENILIQGRGDTIKAYVIDFGFLCSMQKQPNWPTCSGLQGTRVYWSPQIWDAKRSGLPYRQTKADDMYALGLIIYEVWTGSDLGDEGADDDLRLWRRKRDTQEQPMGKLVLKLIDEEPGKRPTAEQVQAELDEMSEPGYSLQATAGARRRSASPVRESQRGPLRGSARVSKPQSWSNLPLPIFGEMEMPQDWPQLPVQEEAFPWLEQMPQEEVLGLAQL
jgi:serine/threonine protein kinase